MAMCSKQLFLKATIVKKPVSSYYLLDIATLIDVGNVTKLELCAESMVRGWPTSLWATHIYQICVAVRELELASSWN